MNNPVKPIPCKLCDIKKEGAYEYTYKVETDMLPQAHGQFFQLSIPKIGEVPISVSSFGGGWIDFTIRAVGKVTNEIFEKCPGDTLFLRGPYGKGWPVEKFKDKHMVVITGGTGLAPVRSMLNLFSDTEDFTKSVHLLSGFKEEEGIIFRSELKEWSNKFRTIYTLDKDKIDGWEVGFVTDHISKIPFGDLEENYETVIVGPPLMMKYTAEACMKAGVPEDRIWVSFERKMSCAVGKCGHCRIDEVYVCLEGPVFPYGQAKNLID